MTWRIKPDLAWVEGKDANDPAWLISADRGCIFTVSTVAFIIWQAADEAASVDDVIDRLVHDQGWDRQEIGDVVAQFLTLLTEQQLLEEVTA